MASLCTRVVKYWFLLDLLINVCIGNFLSFARIWKFEENHWRSSLFALSLIHLNVNECGRVWEIKVKFKNKPNRFVTSSPLRYICGIIDFSPIDCEIFLFLSDRFNSTKKNEDLNEKINLFAWKRGRHYLKCHT